MRVFPVVTVAAAAGVTLALGLAARTAGAGQAAGPTTMPAKVQVIPSAQVMEVFKKGGPFAATAEYKVSAGRRDQVGEVEVHARENDVFYILEGSATLVTGGTVQDAKTVSPGETRGSSIAGGDSRTVSKGDVVIIPRGVPHWFKDLPQAPLLYFVVKPLAPAGAK